MRKGFWTITLLCVSLLCCGYSYRGEWSKATFTVNEDYCEPSTDMGVLGIKASDGSYKYMKLPFSVRLVEDAGYELIDDKDQQFKPWTESYAVRAYDTEGRALSMLVKNDSDTTVGVSECNVYRLTYTPTDDKEVGTLDMKMAGISPTSTQMDMINLHGTNSSSYDVGGVTYASWETAKEEYTFNIDYDVNGSFVKMTMGVDESDKEYGSVWDDYLAGYDDHTPSPVLPSSNGVRSLLGVVIGLGSFVLVVSFVAIFLVYRAHKKKLELRQQEIDLQYLNTDVEEETDDLLDKYR